MFLTLVEYRLKLSEERQLVGNKLNEFENLLTSALNDGISAAKTLAFFAQNQEDVVQNFEDLGRQILESNPQVDVIEFLDSGTIVAVYPMQGNEMVLGYNVLQGSANYREVEESIRRKEVYFSGPVNLRQGGKGIVGRYPLFDGGKFVGLSAVIIHFDKLVERASLAIHNENIFEVQLDRANPNTEKPAAGGDSPRYTGHKATVPIEAGDWILSVQLKKSMALHDLRWFILGRMVISMLLGYAAWNFARQPSLLIKKLKEKSEEILHANERFELAGKATSDVLWDWDLASDQVYRSDRFFGILGYRDKALTGNRDFWESIIHPEDLPVIKTRLFLTLEGTEQYWSQEFRVKKADNSYAYIIDKGFIVRNAKGKAIRMIGAFQDISARKAAELELLTVNRRLSNANDELKVFASLASHDLREPLRMISSFLSLLDTKYGPGLDEKARQYISFAMDGAKRLTVMIADLLEYSKVGFESSATGQINTQALVEEVLKLKSNLIRESDAEVTADRLPDIQGVKTPIQLVFQNLIGNALKYRRPDTKPKIEISGRELEDFWEFSVQDNGIGIDGEYLEQIFGILKRLHPKEKYPGTGMGLATCRKIVSQHGGEIWAESAIGQGSKFVFTIKKHEQRPD